MAITSLKTVLLYKFKLSIYRDTVVPQKFAGITLTACLIADYYTLFFNSPCLDQYIQSGNFHYYCSQ